MQNRIKAERAKMFLPYESLNGFRYQLQQHDQVKIVKKELMIDARELLDRKIQQVKVGKMISIVYYHKDHYVSLEGMVAKIDRDYQKIMRIVDKDISLLDIIQISGEEIDEE